MLRGLSTAASGMLTDERYQQLLANNLANMQTPGYKASDGEILSFPEQLTQMMNGGLPNGTTIGKLGTGAVFQEGVPLFQEGTLTQTNRNLDVAIVDTAPSGTYVVHSPVQGGPAGRIVQGPNGNEQNVAVVDPNGNVVPGVFAVSNPKYQGGSFFGETGRADFDVNGNPSYVFENGQGKVVGMPGQLQTAGWSLRVGTNSTMGFHSFYPVSYTADNGQTGIVLTHDGHLDVNNNHELIDASGNPILPVGANGMPIFGARIVLNPTYQGAEVFQPDGNPVTDKNGVASYQVVNQNGQPVQGAKFGTVNADITKLSPLGQSEFLVGGTFNTNSVLGALQQGTGQIKVGQLENSNVDPVYTMTQMMNIVNQYQANQQVIQTEDGLLTKAVDDVGKVNA